MLPTQINEVYKYLCAKTGNPTEFTRQLALAGNEFTPVEAVLYLPMYSMGMGQSGITRRIQALRDLKFTVEGANAGQFTTEQIAGLNIGNRVRFGMPNRVDQLLDRAKRITAYGAQALTLALQPRPDWTTNDLVEPFALLSGFPGVGNAAALHILMDLGWGVVKPDRHICRFLSRLGGPWRRYFPGKPTTVLPAPLMLNFAATWRDICAGFTTSSLPPPPPRGAVTFPPLADLTSRQIDILIMWFTQKPGPDELAWHPAPLCGAKKQCALCMVPDCPARQADDPAAIPK